MIKVVAVLCAWANPGDCHDQLVTSSDFAELSITECLMGAPQLAEWMRSYPQYRLAKWRCVIGEQKREHA